ncbi:MAG: M56 family peptidase [Acidimicrobiales bacterium]|nr:MAG: M56 family peptidase [Acidimicrobiales bacterium]
MIAVHLLLFATLVAVAVPRLLPQANWVYRSPQLGLFAWYAVLAVMLSSSLGAVLSLLVHWPNPRYVACAWWAWCVNTLAGSNGLVDRVFSGVVLVLAGSVVYRGARETWRTARRAARQRRQHARVLAMVGRSDAELGAMVVQHRQPVAYMVSGTVVVTSGAIKALPAGQLAAVLAHERAHAAGRHHLLLECARLLTAAFPKAAVFAQAHQQIGRLVELRADDVAISGHSRLDLARALVTCAEAAAQVTALIPVGAVAATGGRALERIERLLAPPTPLPQWARFAAMAGLVAVLSVPVLLTALTKVFPVLASCLQAQW